MSLYGGFGWKIHKLSEQRVNEGSLEHTNEVRLTFSSNEEGDLAARNAIATIRNSFEYKFITMDNVA